MHGLCENMPVSLGSGGLRGVFDLIALMGARWLCGSWVHGGACATIAVDCRCKLGSAAYAARPLSD